MKFTPVVRHSNCCAQTFSFRKRSVIFEDSPECRRTASSNCTELPSCIKRERRRNPQKGAALILLRAQSVSRSSLGCFSPSATASRQLSLHSSSNFPDGWMRSAWPSCRKRFSTSDDQDVRLRQPRFRHRCQRRAGGSVRVVVRTETVTTIPCVPGTLTACAAASNSGSPMRELVHQIMVLG